MQIPQERGRSGRLSPRPAIPAPPLAGDGGPGTWADRAAPDGSAAAGRRRHLVQGSFPLLDALIAASAYGAQRATVAPASWEVAMEAEEAARPLAARLDQLPHTVAALRRLVADIARRPAPLGGAEPAEEPARLHAGDLDGFTARATFRVPAMLFARDLPAICAARGAHGTLEILGGLSLSGGPQPGQSAAAALYAAASRCLRAPPGSHPPACEELSRAVEAHLDGGACDAETPVGRLALICMAAAHALARPLLSALLSQAATPGTEAVAA